MDRTSIVLERLRRAFWVLPAIGIALGVVLGTVMPVLDRHVQLPDVVALSGKAETARPLLQTVATLAVSVAGVSFSVIVVALVLGSQQLSPRVLPNFQRDLLNQAVLAVFLGTVGYALYVIAAIEEPPAAVPETSVALAMLLAAFSLGLFVVFLHHAVRSLNASAVIRRIAAEGQRSIAQPYPCRAGGEAEDRVAAQALAAELRDAWPGREVRAPRAGFLVSVDGASLVRQAASCQGLVVQERELGDFVLTEGTLAVVHAPPDARERLVAAVRDAFVLGEERTVDGDIAFPLRQLADVALKGLSPGINDPTTAENAMNSVGDTLVRIARRDPVAALRVDGDGVPRLQARMPSFDDLARLAFDPVRSSGAGRPTFAVRLLEVIADVQDAGGPVARASAELERQADLVLRDADDRTPEHDARTVREAYDGPHGGDRGARVR